METTLYQRFDPRLARRAVRRSHEGIPLGSDLRIGWQTGHTNQAFRIGDGRFSERCDPRRQRVDKHIKLGVGKRSVDVAVTFREIAADIVSPEQHLQCTTQTRQTRQTGHRAAARDEPRANFPLREDCLLAARNAPIAREGKLAAHSRRATAH
jgi:hypothetical protein